MVLIIGTQEEILKYKESPAVNQSTLKNLEGGLLDFQRKQAREDVSKPYLDTGSAIDTVLTGEEGAFERDFYVSTLDKKPSEKIQEMLQWIFERKYHNGNLMSQKDLIAEASSLFEYQPNWGEETKVKKISEDTVNQAYWLDLCESAGKTILTMEQWETIQKVVDSLGTNPLTAGYFDRGLTQKNLIRLYQKPIYFEYEGIRCKALPDIVDIIVNEDATKVVSVQVIDVKTTSKDTIHFAESALNYRYDIQVAFYDLALQWAYADYWESIMDVLGRRIEDVESYCTINPEFIVESTTSTGTPLIYKTTANFLLRGRFGEFPKIKQSESIAYALNGMGVLKSTSKTVYGIEDYIKEYRYYLDNNFSEDIRLIFGKHLLL